jgi:putative FmdB family regulatory protein
MPIFEYSCDECGTKFEKLVRRSSDAEGVRCPSCGQNHLTTEYSTFAAHSGTPKSASSGIEDCGAGMCGGGMCQDGMCGMNMN